MCAIFGIIGETNLSLLKRMSSCQLYRGPDSQNFYENKKSNFSIGMNRLSVIDRKNGKQPMFSHDKRFIGVFNGAIYNFIEIKNFLEKKKISFKTNSDTEVLINAYSYWGNKSFNYFDGMWASCIYDFKKQSVNLSRDYVGQKPLFYYKDKKKLIFSSQINGIFEYRKKFSISKVNYEEYLRFNHFPAPKTLYKDIYQLCPGQYIEFNNKKITLKNYWKVENGGDYNIFFEHHNKKKIENNFEKIINKFLIADKKVGLCLSSGIDSNLIKSYMMKVKNNINSFTIGFKEKSYDESKYVKKERFNNNIKKILTEKNFINTFKKIKKNTYFPFGDSSSVPTYELFNLVKKKTNVTLGGDGGDEIFFGYLSFRGFYLAQLIRSFVPIFVIKLIKIFSSKIKITTNYLGLKKKIKYFFKFLDKKLFLINNYWISNFDEKDVQDYFNKKNIGLSPEFKKIQKIYNTNNDEMKFAQIYYMKYFLPLILTKVDYSSMLNSVESRSPFLSKDLVNFSIDLPSNKNFSLFKNRKLMKNIFFYHLSNYNDIKKHGFAFNKYSILKNEKLIKKMINKDLILNLNFFNKKYDDYLSGNYDYEQYLWNEIILNFSRQNLECE
jgi:asparagine synthase (glutamine-hydrolysing)